MRLAQMDGDTVANVIEVQEGAVPDWAYGWPEAGDAGPGWVLVEGVLVPPAEPAPDLAQLIALYQSAIQRHIDATARARDYDNGVLAASYVASTITLWAAEAQAFVAWRDAVWVHSLALLADVMGGQEAPPAVADVVAGLPLMVWPE